MCAQRGRGLLPFPCIGSWGVDALWIVKTRKFSKARLRKLEREAVRRDRRKDDKVRFVRSPKVAAVLREIAAWEKLSCEAWTRMEELIRRGKESRRKLRKTDVTITAPQAPELEDRKER